MKPEKSDFILAMIKQVELYEAINHLTLTKKSEVKNRHKNKYGKLKASLSIWSFKRKIFTCVRLMKYKALIYAHGEMKQWVVNYW